MTAVTTLSTPGADTTHRAGRATAAHHGHTAKGGASALGFAQALADMLNSAPTEAAAATSVTTAEAPDTPTPLLPDVATAQTTAAAEAATPETTTAELLPALAAPAAALPEAAPVATPDITPTPGVATPELASDAQKPALENQLPIAPTPQPTIPKPAQTEASSKDKPNDQSEIEKEPDLQANQTQPAPTVIAANPPPPPSNPQVKFAGSAELQVTAGTKPHVTRTAQADNKPETADSTAEARSTDDSDEPVAKAEPNRVAPSRPAPTGFEMQSQHRSDAQTRDQPKLDKSPDIAPAPAPMADTSAPMVTDSSPAATISEVQSEPLIVNQPDWEGTLADHIAAHLSEDGDKLELQLSPDNLGQLTITLEMTDGGAQVTILTETADAASLFQQSEHRLSDALQKTGLQLSSQDANQRQLGNSDQSGQGNRQPTRGGTDFALSRQNDRITPNPNAGRQQASLLNIVA